MQVTTTKVTTMKGIIIAFLIGLVPGHVTAEVVTAEVPPTISGTISRGMMCETVDQLHTYLDAAEHTESPVVEGCGMLMVRTPWGQPMRIHAVFEPKHWYRVGKNEALVSMIILPPSPSHPEGLRSYGWIAYRVVDDVPI